MGRETRYTKPATETLCSSRTWQGQCPPSRLAGAQPKVARLGRFELPTVGLEGRCSIQLSYRRVLGRLLAQKTPVERLCRKDDLV